MNKIYVILGKSASGKDSIYQLLTQKCKLNPIVYYTTRPIRNGEEHGKDYFYVDEKFINEAEANGKLIERRVYNTIKGLWTYATIFDKQFETEEDGIIVLPPQAYYSFIEYFGKEKIVPLHIHVPDGIRLRRSIERDEKQDNPNYEETCRRFLSDANDFRDLVVNRTFLNDDLNRCCEEIIETMNFTRK
jgi:guanylate kinase